MEYIPQLYWESRGVGYQADNDDEELVILGNLIKPEDTLLEVGSGDGRVYQALKKKEAKFKIFGMCDIADSFIQSCYRKTGMKPKKWDGVTLPYEDSLFDMVISFSVMLHVPPENIDRFLKEHIRVSKDRIFIATWYVPHTSQSAYHCFLHDYPKLFNDNNLKIIEEFETYLEGNEHTRRVWLLQVNKQ